MRTVTHCIDSTDTLTDEPGKFNQKYFVFDIQNSSLLGECFAKSFTDAIMQIANLCGLNCMNLKAVHCSIYKKLPKNGSMASLGWKITPKK